MAGAVQPEALRVRKVQLHRVHPQVCGVADARFHPVDGEELAAGVEHEVAFGVVRPILGGDRQPVGCVYSIRLRCVGSAVAQHYIARQITVGDGGNRLSGPVEVAGEQLCGFPVCTRSDNAGIGAQGESCITRFRCPMFDAGRCSWKLLCHNRIGLRGR
ncbi:hypothetical protein [Nocardia seriolae]|uniref:hypothetical protein n=1 Tax=Nocardia seriolae TaxID=37332 RepID=UPI001E3D5C03|nr:hypothetical protein [Nocardia seriolae]